MSRRPLLCLLALATAPLLGACAAPFFAGARDFIAVEDITQVPESDRFEMRDLLVDRDSLRFIAGYGGGCRVHAFTLYASRATADTALLYIQHNANNDLCRAWINTDSVAFSLRGLKKDLKLNLTTMLRIVGQHADSGWVVAY